MKSDVWKWIAGILSSVMLTGAAAWFSFGGGVSRAEGQEINKKISSAEQKLAVFEEKLSAQQRTLDEVKVEVKQGNIATQGKLDAILMALPRSGRNPNGDNP